MIVEKEFKNARILLSGNELLVLALHEKLMLSLKLGISAIIFGLLEELSCL